MTELGYKIKVRKFSNKNETFKTKIEYDPKNIRLQLLFKRFNKNKRHPIWLELSNIKDKLLKPLQPLMEAEQISNINYEL